MAWGPIGPSGHLKASLNKSNRQKMHQSVECYIIYWNSYTKWVSKPSTFLTNSPYLPRSPMTNDRSNKLFPTDSLTHRPVKHPQKLFINDDAADNTHPPFFLY
jgi:hypothetical protein